MIGIRRNMKTNQIVNAKEVCHSDFPNLIIRRKFVSLPNPKSISGMSIAVGDGQNLSQETPPTSREQKHEYSKAITLRRDVSNGMGRATLSESQEDSQGNAIYFDKNVCLTEQRTLLLCPVFSVWQPSGRRNLPSLRGTETSKR